MSTLATILATAAEGGEQESAGTLFYVVGGALAVFAVVVSVIGIRWSPSTGAARALIAVSVVFVAGTMVAAVLSAG